MTIIPPDIQTVVIQFEGICVNFSQISFPFLPTAHRIVLINASTIDNVWGNIIDPHLAGFSAGQSGELPLTGAIVQITNPITTGQQTGVTYDPSYQSIPSLTMLTPGLSPVSQAVLVGQNPDLAACYFDVDFGTISSTVSPLGATMTVVTILTNGAPQYQITPFATGLSSPPLLIPELLPATNSMSFWNEEQSIKGASNNDFMLSYLVVNPPPSSPPNLPKSTGAGPTPNRKSTILKAVAVSVQPVALTDLGCSNSAYP